MSLREADRGYHGATHIVVRQPVSIDQSNAPFQYVVIEVHDNTGGCCSFVVYSGTGDKLTIEVAPSAGDPG